MKKIIFTVFYQRNILIFLNCKQYLYHNKKILFLRTLIFKSVLKDQQFKRYKCFKIRGAMKSIKGPR